MCGPCTRGNRTCVYDATFSVSRPARSNTVQSRSAAAQAPSNQEQHSAQHGSLPINVESETSTSSPMRVDRVEDDSAQMMGPQSTHSTGIYGTEAAPLRWFGLLATDAADISLDLPTLERQGEDASTQRHSLQPHAVSTDGLPIVEPTNSHQDLELSPSSSSNGSSEPSEKKLWQAQALIELTGHEHDYFKRFVEGVSLWLDLLDPLKHFSTLVPHLALRNDGLLKAVLAVGARHVSLKPIHDADPNVDKSMAVQYYSEATLYLQSAMRYTTYKNSSELLATLTVVSMYEMIDGADKLWERHLKGLFWIQRSRNINGESGGFPQANWYDIQRTTFPWLYLSNMRRSRWAWLRQDVWAAFRERRRCFSFFCPTRQYQTMDIW